MILFCNLLILLLVKPSWTTVISMKVVEAPISYGLNNDITGTNFNKESLTLLVPPSDFSGPEHLKPLSGRCYNFTDENYRYAFCPFRNVTQHELTNRWNSYQGILGVWQEWKIINNTFSSMMMLKGDKCGDVHRSVEVVLTCNQSEGIEQVAEPFKCNYILIFSTPLVCYSHALLVYPSLSEPLRSKWDQLETDLNLQFISQKGYEKGLEEVFVEAGYQQKKTSEIELKKDKQNESTPETGFTNLNSCQKEVEELRNEIEGLKILLDLKAISEVPKTKKHN